MNSKTLYEFFVKRIKNENQEASVFIFSYDELLFNLSLASKSPLK